MCVLKLLPAACATSWSSFFKLRHRLQCVLQVNQRVCKFLDIYFFRFKNSSFIVN